MVALLVLLAVLLGASAEADSAPTHKARKDLIAFVSTGSGTPQLYTVRSDASRLRQLTDDPLGVGRPQWAFDGKRVLVLTGCEDSSGRCLEPTGFATMRADGSNRVDIAGIEPAISPDGVRVAYTVCAGTSCSLWVAKANGRHQVLLDTDVQRPVVPGEPAWSSDSKQLLYVKTVGPFERSIWLADLRGETTGEVLSGIDVPVSTPVFFPDEMTVTFVTGFAARLFSVSLGDPLPVRRGLLGETGYLIQSPTRTRLASQAFSRGPGGFIASYSSNLNQFGEFEAELRTPPNALDPVWSSDGSRIAYSFCDRTTSGFPGGPCSVQVVAGTDSNPVIVFDGPAVEGPDWVRGYSWSRDSSSLVLSLAESGEPFRLTVVGADGTGSAPLLSGSDNQYTPAWQP